MVAVIKKLAGNRLFYNSFIMLAGGTLMNSGNYIYHLLMGRVLGPVQYGILASLISILYLIFIPSGALNLMITKIVAQFKGKGEYGKISHLFYVLTRWIFILSIIVVLVFFLGNNQLADFLKISDRSAIIAVGGIFLLFFLLSLNRSVIQGLQKFEILSFSNIFEVSCKVIFGIVLVNLGFGVTGAVVAILLTEILTYLITLFFLKTKWLTKPDNSSISKKIFLRSLSTPFVTFFCITSLYSVDIILVKHFLPEYEAGLYAALAVMGKIIFFASSSVTLVMYPMISEAFEKKEPHNHLFGYSFFFVLLVSFFLTTTYYLYPQLWVNLFFGQDYLSIAPYLGTFAVFISLYSLNNLFINFFLATNQNIFLPFLIFSALFQIIGISYFHQSIFQVILVSIFVCIILLISMIAIFLNRTLVNKTLPGTLWR